MTDETYTIPDKGIAITANNYRFTWMVPFQAVVAYHFNPDKMISPFVGLGYRRRLHGTSPDDPGI